MSGFLEKYVRSPLNALLAHPVEVEALPDLHVSISRNALTFRLGDGALWSSPRSAPDPDLADENDAIPDDAEDLLAPDL